ncbi:unnamed protein product [Lepeophtheirus salmonis]|uniref:(salmon louse) hypothetical protein n=1 Tax=Lepeophtheirus salmonis TaxID=72036 RepID=A0A7R8D693_LEPSM|nr:unnamed protein product [Lepeophtheirus salmonis]CAF2987320.1 unnamed protein product [Lepeophtheirus salmonis]
MIWNPWTVFLLIASLPNFLEGRNILLKSAPQLCPIEDGNLIGVELFVEDEEECFKFCENSKECLFFRFFHALDQKPSQCYLFNTCGRHVESATSNCQLSRENTIDVRPFVPTESQCQIRCQQERDCGYYKYFTDESSLESLDESNDVLLTLKEDTKSEFCYLLRSCAKRMVEKTKCVLGKNNFLDVKFFKESEHPMYCYLFRQCAASDAEPEVTLILGGRHPGHHFISNKDENDVVSRNEVCTLAMSESSFAELDRAGATSEYVNGTMSEPREEASSVTIGSVTYVIGGVGSRTIEGFDANKESPSTSWLLGPDMPGERARSCAVTIDNQTLVVIGGHNNLTMIPQSSTFVLNIEDSIWRQDAIPDMIEARMDHACVYVEFEDTHGILVSGGLGPEKQVLDSVEFYDILTQKWTLTSALKVGRTEHTMSLVYGIPTVTGGLSSNEFLSSIEQFDKSSNSWNVPLKREWKVISHSLKSPRYEMTSVSIPASRLDTCDATII